MDIISNFPQIVKRHLSHLPKDDYPVLNTFLFVSCWISFVLDQSQVSMRSLFKHLNVQNIKVDISTFSKASKTRDPSVFHDLFFKLKAQLSQVKQTKGNVLVLFPLDSTIVTLTSKLFWQQKYHQVKLFSGLNILTAEPGGILIHFGQGHDSKHGDETIDETPENGVAIMDRGFCKLGRIRKLLTQVNRYFLLRVKNNSVIEMLENGLCRLGTGAEQVELRLVMFCDLEKRTEFRFATNLPHTGECALTNEEIADLYRYRWQIELFWKFLKMHLKLDRLITKNKNGVEIQIYSCLIAYLLLQLVEIPKQFGNKALDKLRYLQAFMSENVSYVHWFRKLVLTG